MNMYRYKRYTFATFNINKMSATKVTILTLKDITTREQAKRFMDNKATIKITDMKGHRITIPPGTIKELKNSSIGGASEDGWGDIYNMSVPKKFIPDVDYTSKNGNENSWSLYTLIHIYQSDDYWNRHMPLPKKQKLRKVLDYLYANGKYTTTNRTTGGSLGRGNTTTCSEQAPIFNARVIPVENPVTIPNYWEYGIAKHSHPSSREWDPVIYFSFVQNASIINFMNDELKQAMVESYNYLLDHDNYSYTPARELGLILKLMFEGGFKYILHRTYSGGIFIHMTSDHCVMNIGLPPKLVLGTIVEGNYRGHGKWLPGTIITLNGNSTFNVRYNNGNTQTMRPEHIRPLQKPITTGGGLHFMKSIAPFEYYSPVTIDPVKEIGIHFGSYGMLKPGELYIFSIFNSDGVTHYWSFPAPHGGFIYQPLDGDDCLNYGCVVLPFGISKDEQQKQVGTQEKELLSRCILCFKDNSAKIGYQCNGTYKHCFICPQCFNDDADTISSRFTQCPICREEHDASISILIQ